MPTAVLLPDRDEVLAAVQDIRATYNSAGLGPAMAKFIMPVMHDGLLTEDYLRQPAPDPAAFGLPSEDDGSRTDPLMRNMPGCNTYRPDFAALAELGSRVVLAAGVESGEQMAARGGRSVAEKLGVPITEYPSDMVGSWAGGTASMASPTPSPPRCARRWTD